MSANERYLEAPTLSVYGDENKFQGQVCLRLNIMFRTADSSKCHPVPEFPQNLQLDIHSTVSYFIGLISPRGFSDINILKDLKGTSQSSTEEVKLYMPRYNITQDKSEIF